MTDQKKLNLGVIGLGWVATNRHIPCLLKNSQVHLYGVMDRQAVRVNKVLSHYPWLQASIADKIDINWIKNIDAVIVATDPLNHFSLAREALLLGKNVLIEKPFAMSVSEGQELQTIALEKKCKCCVVHNFQYADSVKKLKGLIDNGHIGKILSIEAIQWSNPLRRLPTWYEQLPFGLFYDESPHMFYLLQYLLDGKIEYLYSSVVCSNKRKTPVSVTALYLGLNVPVRIVMNFMTSLSEWQVVVFGSKGVGIVDIFRDILVLVPNDNLHQAKDILKTTAFVTSTHLLGTIKSGVALLQKRLFYGADVVLSKFISAICDDIPPTGISANDGVDVLIKQEEVMYRSDVIDFSS